MTTTNSIQAAQRAAGTLIDGRINGGQLHVFRWDVDYASQAAADIIVLGRKPRGHCFIFGLLNADASSGSTTLSIGITGTVAKYRALAAHTTTDLPVFFGKQAPTEEAEATAEEEIIMTLAAATAPASGNLTVMFITASM